MFHFYILKFNVLKKSSIERKREKIPHFEKEKGEIGQGEEREGERREKGRKKE